MRGLFTAGVIDVFLEREIPFDGVVGVSAGACFGCNYVSRQAGRVIRYNKRFAKDPRYCSFGSLWRRGNLFDAEFCYHRLPTELDVFDAEAFERSSCEFWISATDVETGKPRYRRIAKADYDAFEWILASASMPLVSRPVEREGRLYLDGGLSDGIPLRFFESRGFTRNVVVTTRPHGYRKFPSWKTALSKPFLLRYPAVYRALRTRHVWYNAELEHVDARVAAGAALLIAPDEPLEISRLCHDPDVMQRVYDIGRSVAERRLGEVLDFIGRKR